jgi:bacteriorhodopsin
MAHLDGFGSSGATVEFMTAGVLVYGIVAAACSSPQTAEINADKRSKTLMKWVYLGVGQAAIFVVIATKIADHPSAVVAGGSLAGAMMLASYAHAKRAGMSSNEAGTES